MITANDYTAIVPTLSLHGLFVDLGRLDELDRVFSPDVTLNLEAYGLGTRIGLANVRQGALSPAMRTRSRTA